VSPRPRLILADDHHLLVEGLRSTLGRHFSIAAIAHDGDELLALLPATDADCLLLDISLPGRNGLELIPEVKRMKPDMAVLIVTMHLHRSLADAALHSGANGFIPKDSGIEELEAAITTVLGGGRYLSPRIPPHSQHLSIDAAHPALSKLTPRQQEIVQLIGDGKSTAEIAAILGLSQRTVGFHRTNIRKTLGIDSEMGLARQAVLFRMGQSAMPDSPTPAIPGSTPR
jgi:DNA-binding NarL/FixJ family response regulator